MPVIIDANGTILQSFRKYLSNIMKSTKTFILGTAHILQKVVI
jgi:hypothetical protein